MNKTLIDRIVEYVSPAAGARRAYARYSIEMAYQAARMRRQAGTVSHAGPNIENIEAGAALRARSHDQVRNSALAKNAKAQWGARLWATGIVPIWEEGKGRNQKLGALWDQWAPTCWGNGPSPKGSKWEQAGLQIVNAAFESGDALIIRRIRQPYEKRPLNMTIDILEPDHLDTTRDGQALADGGYIRGGIEFSATGERRAYHLLDVHPGEIEIRPFSYRSKRVPAEDVVHMYRPDRPGAVTGVPANAAVAELIDEGRDYVRFDILQKKVAACFAAFVTRPDADAPPLAPENGRMPSGARREKIDPAMIHYLANGESVEIAAPAQAGGVRETMAVIGREIAAGYHMPYALLTGDWSDSNYSSSRSGLIGFADVISQYRWLVLLPALDAIVDWFVQAAYVVGLLDVDKVDRDWTEPEFRLLDRLNEAEADQIELNLGTMTWAQAVQAKGYDPEVQAEEIVRWKAAREAAQVTQPVTNRVQSAQNGNGKGKASPPTDSNSGDSAR